LCGAAETVFFRTDNSLRILGDKHPVLYLDETRVNQNHSRRYTSQVSARKRGLIVLSGNWSGLTVCTQDN
jgi:hypothetical protein